MLIACSWCITSLCATAIAATAATTAAFAARLGAILEHERLPFASTAVPRPLATLRRPPFVDAGRCRSVRARIVRVRIVRVRIVGVRIVRVRRVGVLHTTEIVRHDRNDPAHESEGV